MKIDLIPAGKLANFQEGWHLVQSNPDVEATLDLIGVAKSHPDFDLLNDSLLVREDEVSEGFIKTVLSVRIPWAITSPVYEIVRSCDDD